MILQLFGAKVSEGAFIGAFLSMSSTAVVCSPSPNFLLKNFAGTRYMHYIYVSASVHQLDFSIVAGGKVPSGAQQ